MRIGHKPFVHSIDLRAPKGWFLAGDDGNEFTILVLYSGREFVTVANGVVAGGSSARAVSVVERACWH